MVVIEQAGKRLEDRIKELEENQKVPVLSFRKELDVSDITAIIKGTHYGMPVALFGKTRAETGNISELLLFLHHPHTIESYPDGMLISI